jgi:cobyrinic acid a,c-diamide synthase
VVSVARLVIAGSGSGVGKTTVATGLMAALRRRGLKVAGFKVGPDFIDPSYHALATGRPGRNLDAFLSGPDLIAPLFAHGGHGADVAVIEGVMGLFDGKSGGGELASTAQVAKLLRAPVVLVVDAAAMARSAAAMVHGFDRFDPELRIAALVLNRVASDRHEATLRESLAPLGVPIVGVLRRDDGLASPERHLGLVPVAERRRLAARTVETLGAAVAAACDLDAVMGLAGGAPALTARAWDPRDAVGRDGPAEARVAVAGGPAFSFRYKENLELLAAAGAPPVAFDPLRDPALPADAGALYLGGGFPEQFAPELSANLPLRAAVAGFVRSRRPVIAECGGLLYLSRELDGLPMCGAIDARGRMTDRLTLGYREAVAAAGSPLCHPGARVRAHEFHYSKIEPEAGSSPAWVLGDRAEGFAAGAIHASYLHTHWAATPTVADRLARAAAGRPVEALA